MNKPTNMRNRNAFKIVERVKEQRLHYRGLLVKYNLISNVPNDMDYVLLPPCGFLFATTNIPLLLSKTFFVPFNKLKFIYCSNIRENKKTPKEVVIF